MYDELVVEENGGKPPHSKPSQWGRTVGYLIIFLIPLFGIYMCVYVSYPLVWFIGVTIDMDYLKIIV